MKNGLVFLGFGLGLLAAGPALADACSAIEAGVAEKAATYLRQGDTIQEYCEPCGDKKAKKTVINSLDVKIVRQGGQYDSTVNVNGSSLDLAYAYVQAPPDRKVWTNLGHLAQCEAYDEDSGPKTLPERLVGN